MQVFATQIKKAIELGKAIVVHSRSAEDETYQILKENAKKETRIHMHCYGESEAQAKRLMDEFPNLYFGFTGAITFDNSDKICKVIRDVIPIERILLETDSPYMSPQKGAICTPAVIPIIAQRIAELKGLSIEKTLEAIRINTKNMYNI